jgi:hypothetical protein
MDILVVVGDVDQCAIETFIFEKETLLAMEQTRVEALLLKERKEPGDVDAGSISNQQHPWPSRFGSGSPRCADERNRLDDLMQPLQDRFGSISLHRRFVLPAGTRAPCDAAGLHLPCPDEARDTAGHG